jgi:hypothetical protein
MIMESVDSPGVRRAPENRRTPDKKRRARFAAPSAAKPAQGAVIQDHVHPEPPVITCAITHRSHTMSHRASDVNTPGHDVDHFFIATTAGV